MTPRIISSLAVMLAVLTPLRAEEPVANDGLTSMPMLLAAPPAMGGKKKADEEKSRFPKFKDVTKDMESAKGLFTLWSYPASAKNKDPEKLLCQIPASFLGEQFMLSTSIAGGGMFTGFPLDERVVKWEILDKKLLLIEPNSGYVVEKRKEIQDVVDRTYPDRIRTAVPIVTMSPGGDPVIDLGPLLKSNFADVQWTSFGAGGSISRSLSKWTAKKTFELNVEIGVEMAMSATRPPGSYDKRLVHYSFWKLPKSDYKPRKADDRVGYFLTVNRDWSKPAAARDIFNRYIDRWHLVKQDPSLALCEPKQPIIFYIEKTVPIQHRRAVRDGILEWNKAFEKCGFVDAVQVRQQTNTNEWKDIDPEDMRYSFFRWIVSGSAFAMGPHRANPFTGQIYDADIIFDDSMIRVMGNAATRLLPSAVARGKFNDPVLEEFLKANPQFARPERNWEHVTIGDDSLENVTAEMRKRLHARGRPHCDYINGKRQQMAVARTMLAGQPKEVLDKYMYEVVREVVMHEVGHTIGLRHNFKASTIYTVEEIKQRRETGEPLVGSVMDYNATLFFHDKPLDGSFITQTVGPYDYWAIEYGYRPADGTYKAVTQDDADADKSDDAKTAELVAGKSADYDIPKDVLDQLPDDVRKMIDKKRNKTKSLTEKKPAKSATIAGEEAMLAAIASRSTEPELAYATDEDTTSGSPDPRNNRFDMGADPINWARERMKVIDGRMANILEWSVEDKESWYHARSAYLSLLFDKAFVLDYVGRYIGGVYTHRAHRGDPGDQAPFEVVDAKRQRDALAFMETTIFDDDFFATPPEVLNHLATSRWWHEGTSVSFTEDFTFHRYISLLQWWNLFDRMYPNTLRRIQDNELRTDGDDVLTLSEYIQRVQDVCWATSVDTKRAKKGNWTDTAPFIPGVRRSLQREYLSVIEPIMRTKPGTIVSPDIHAMVRLSMSDLGGKVNNALATGKLDFASRAHLTACKSRIERLLAAELNEYGGF